MKTRTRVIIILLCVLFLGGVITVTILTRNNSEPYVPPTGDVEQNGDTTDNEEVVFGEGYTLVDFGGTNCKPCQKLQPILQSLREAYENIDIRFYDIQRTSLGATLARQYKISAMPTLVFFEDGQEIYRFVGFRYDIDMEEYIEGFFRDFGWIE